MYLLDYNHPTELFDERRDTRLARELRAARSKGDAGRKRGRWGELVRPTIPLWGRPGGTRAERNRGQTYER